MVKKTQIGTSENWFRITIPGGIRYDKIWLMNLLQNHCRVPFTPVDFHYVKNRARFFVEDAKAASALREVSCKIYDKENRKICIFVNQSGEPYSVWNMLEPEEMEQLELTMKKRYNVSQQSLDLQSLRYDPDLVGHDIDIILNRRNCMAATLQIIEKSFPQLLSINLCNNKLYQLDGLSDIVQMVPTVKILNLSKNMLKSTWEVSKMKGLKLEELRLDGNPLCDTFSNKSSYVSSILELFPKLLRLPRSYHYQPARYFWIYDCGDRKSLLSIYHEQACFTLTIPFSPEDPLSRLWQYFKDSKNITNFSEQCKDMRYQLLRHTSLDIVSTLCMLPQTQHDLNSLLVDLWVHMETMLCFSVHGVFKEVDGRSPGSIRAFTRTFTATPGSNSSLCILNDELIVKDTTIETQNVFSISMPTATSNSVPILSQVPHEMAKAISTPSGMTLEWMTIPTPPPPACCPVEVSTFKVCGQLLSSKEKLGSSKDLENVALAHSEYNGSGTSSQEKKKDRNSLGHSCDGSDTNDEHSEYGAQSPNLQEKNGNGEMKNGQEDLEMKHNPNDIQRNKRSVKWHDEDSIHINMWNDKRPAGRKMGENPLDDIAANWFRITIPNGMNYDKTWLINLLRNHCKIHFIPVDFHYVKNRARFFIQNAKVASALMDVNNKIYDEEKQEISILVKKCTEPYSDWNMLELEERDKLEVEWTRCMLCAHPNPQPDLPLLPILNLRSASHLKMALSTSPCR
ncbi:PREDICTED: nuclear RNA export factor 2-like [Condylura cristata]|uniref:nuclear RNA export factor 2-like n=1 Tax=Condylura cristata TaxID=143302 RepID=UPI000642DEA5|nr:PREDICTED: nuclear RNA export factor 2-like [Condylura cristata]